MVKYKIIYTLQNGDIYTETEFAENLLTNEQKERMFDKLWASPQIYIEQHGCVITINTSKLISIELIENERPYITNIERIKAMSIDEMAEFIVLELFGGEGHETYIDDEETEKQMIKEYIEYLKSEVEE